jgi:hypothetical protein
MIRDPETTGLSIRYQYQRHTVHTGREIRESLKKSSRHHPAESFLKIFVPSSPRPARLAKNLA